MNRILFIIVALSALAFAIPATLTPAKPGPAKLHKHSLTKCSGTIGSTDPSVDRNRIIVSYALESAEFPGDPVEVTIAASAHKRARSRAARGEFMDTVSGCLHDSTVRISAADERGNFMDTVVPLVRLSKLDTRPIWGYESNGWCTIDLPYDSLKVFVDMDSTARDGNGQLTSWPWNPDMPNGLSRDEILSAITLGLNVWAGIWPKMNWRFVKTPDSANFTVSFRRLDNAGGYSGNPLSLDPRNCAFRQKDRASPKLLYERYAAICGGDSAHWCLWSNLPTQAQGAVVNKINGVTWKTATDSLKSFINRKDPQWLAHQDAIVCVSGDIIAGKPFPSDEIFGRGQLGYADLSLIIQHEFAHNIIGMHDDGYNRPQDPPWFLPCIAFSAKSKEIVRVDNDTLFINRDKFVVRAGFREKHIDSITDSLSPGALFGNTWSYSWNGGRGVFDLDADRLAAPSADPCDCNGDTSGGKYRSSKPVYEVKYPVIRTGWKIVMRNSSGGQFETDNWHVAQDSMGWVRTNDAREARWFLHEVRNPAAVKAAESATSLESLGKKKLKVK